MRFDYTMPFTHALHMHLKLTSLQHTTVSTGKRQHSFLRMIRSQRTTPPCIMMYTSSVCVPVCLPIPVHVRVNARFV